VLFPSLPYIDHSFGATPHLIPCSQHGVTANWFSLQFCSITN